MSNKKQTTLDCKRKRTLRHLWIKNFFGYPKTYRRETKKNNNLWLEKEFWHTSDSNISSVIWTITRKYILRKLEKLTRNTFFWLFFDRVEENTWYKCVWGVWVDVWGYWIVIWSLSRVWELVNPCPINWIVRVQKHARVLLLINRKVLMIVTWDALVIFKGAGNRIPFPNDFHKLQGKKWSAACHRRKRFSWSYYNNWT